MKKIRGLKGLVIGIIIMSLMLTGTAFATNRLDALTRDISNVNEDVIMAKLEEKDFAELINDVNVLGDSVDMSDLIFHTNALAEKAAEMPQEQLLNQILNEKNSNTTRVILIQINRLLGNSNETLSTLLGKSNVDFEIKRNVMLNIYRENPVDNISLFEKVALGEDERLAFQAIKMLNEIAPEKAIEISDNIIKNYNGTISDKVRAAIKVKALQLNNFSTQAERQEFISLCDKILTTYGKSKDDIAVDTIIFALSDVKSEETISYIIKNAQIDNVAKIFCIDQNYSVLQSMITENVTSEKIEVVTKSMLIYPINELEEPLQSLLSSQVLQDFATPKETAKTLQDTITLINEKGVNATGKY